jgi:hypothetical protein
VLPDDEPVPSPFTGQMPVVGAHAPVGGQA